LGGFARKENEVKRDTEVPDIYSWVVCDGCGEWCHPTEVTYRYDDCDEYVVCDECRPTMLAPDKGQAAENSNNVGFAPCG